MSAHRVTELKQHSGRGHLAWFRQGRAPPLRFFNFSLSLSGCTSQHVPHSDEPALPSQQPPGPWRFVGSEPTQIAGTPYDQMLPPAHAVLRERHEESEPHRGRVSRNASGGSMPGSTFPEKPASEGDAGAQDTPQPPVPVSMPPSRQSGQNGVSHDTISPQPYNWRMPPITPVLLPEHRFCYRDTLIKPPRAHHCQACGTCVLRFDHHCPCERGAMFSL
jgi:palmitoyltransferase